MRSSVFATVFSGVLLILGYYWRVLDERTDVALLGLAGIVVVALASYVLDRWAER
jgi:hypothetical protein